MFLPWGYSRNFSNRPLRAPRFKRLEREEPKDRSVAEGVVRDKEGSKKFVERKKPSMVRSRKTKGERKE